MFPPKHSYIAMKPLLSAFLSGAMLFMAEANAAATTYSDWKATVFSSVEQANPAISSETADLMKDGMPNVMKYALGLDPHQNQAALIPKASPDSNGYLMMSVVQDSSLTDITYVVEFSTDLVNWNRGGTYVRQIANTPLLGTQSYATYESTVLNTAFQKAFMRLVILEGQALPPYWQLQNFGHTGVDPNADPDGDGLSNFNEYVNGTNPNDFYNGISPTITIVGGGNQSGAPLSVLTTPLTLSVYYQPNAPLTITVTSGTARLSASPTGSSPTSSITLQTSNSGGFGAAVAQVYLTTGTTVSDLSTITITAPGYPASTITTTVGCYDPNLAAPTNLVATVDGPDSATLTWTNNSPNGTAIWESLDYGATWQYVTTVASGLATYEATGLAPGQNIEFQAVAVSATGGGGGSGSSAGGSPPSQPTSPVAADGQPELLMEAQSAALRKYGFPGFVTPTNYYLEKVYQITMTHPEVIGLTNGNGSQTRIIDPVTGHGTVTTVGNQISFVGPLVINSDTLTTLDGSYPPGTSHATNTLSLPNTTAMLKANLLTLLPPFTNTLTNSGYAAYYKLAPDESYAYVTALQYKFKVAPAPNFTLYWDDEFIPDDGSTITDNIQHWSSSTGTERETPVYQITGTALETAGVNGWHEIYPIYITRDGQPITGNNNTVAVGQQINLSIYALGLNITNYQWTIPGVSTGTAFKDYQPNIHNSNFTALAPADLNGPNASSVSFYWSDAADNRPITCRITMNGQLYDFTVTLNVKRPTGAITATVGGPIAVDNNYGNPASPMWLHFGAINDSSPAGMSFSETITLPPDMPKGTTGKFCWVQVVSGSLVQSTYTDIGVITKISSGEDTTFPYENAENQSTTDDSPANSVTVGLHQSKSYDDFGATMYLYWQPTHLPAADSAVWVPLRGVYWHWNGTAISSDGINWTMQSSNLPSGVNDFPVTTEPQWTKNVADP